jgi:hypothetical protein
MMHQYGGCTNGRFSALDKMSTDDLMRILKYDSYASEEEVINQDAILYIMEVVAQRKIAEEPEGSFADVEGALESFYRDYRHKAAADDINPDSSGAAPRTRGLRRVGKTVAALIAAIIFVMAVNITSLAMGYDLLGSIASWTKDKFGFQKEAESVLTIDSASVAGDFAALQDALDAYGVTEPIAPTWIPDGYVLETIDVVNEPEMNLFTAGYVKDGDLITVSINSLSTGSTSSFLKNDGDPVLYTSGGVQHYIMGNMDSLTAAWITGNYECAIFGYISTSEMEQMIDSIYER